MRYAMICFTDSLEAIARDNLTGFITAITDGDLSEYSPLLQAPRAERL